jgi:hypothetical protein
MQSDASTLLLDYLKQHSYGVTFGALLTDLAEHARPGALADALNQAVNDGAVRYIYRPEPAPEKQNCRTDLAFYLAEHLPLSPASPAEIDAVVNYFARREDYERFGGGPWVMLEAATVFEDFAKDLPAAKLAYVFETLRHEQMLKFLARDKNRYVTVTLSAHRYYTVLAMQTEPAALRSAPPTCRLRYFHVRAGSAEVACQKVARIVPDEGTLEVHAVAEGRIQYEAALGKVPVEVEAL